MERGGRAGEGKEKGDKKRLISIMTASAFRLPDFIPDNSLYSISFNPQSNTMDSVIGFVCLVLPVFQRTKLNFTMFMRPAHVVQSLSRV